MTAGLDDPCHNNDDGCHTLPREWANETAATPGIVPDASHDAECHHATCYRTDDEFVGVTDYPGKQKASKPNTSNFEKLMEGPCPNHIFAIKHLFKGCKLMKRYLKGELKPSNKEKHPEPAGGDKEDDTFPDLKGCLMILGGGGIAYESKPR